MQHWMGRTSTLHSVGSCAVNQRSAKGFQLPDTMVHEMRTTFKGLTEAKHVACKINTPGKATAALEPS